ncbi:MAG: hypothetical protein WC635_11270 [Bacteriovorax sp.]|jgi:hypothetical protein
MEMFKKLKTFVNDTYQDQRIPEKDKKIIIGILIILALRLLFIPDWIPYFGILDVLFLIGLIGDYLFGILDQNLLLSHFPWGMKSFARIRRFALFLAFFAPHFVTDHLWEYTKEPF